MNVDKWHSVSVTISRMIRECLALAKLYLFCLNFFIDLYPSQFLEPSVGLYLIRISEKILISRYIYVSVWGRNGDDLISYFELK